jgi:hypothetical protein
VIGLIAMLLTPNYQKFFNAGLVFFAVFHIVIYWIGQLIRVSVQKQG